MPLNFHGYSIHRKERLKSLWQRDSTMSVWDINSFGSYSYWFDVYGNRLMGQKYFVRWLQETFCDFVMTRRSPSSLYPPTMPWSTNLLHSTRGVVVATARDHPPKPPKWFQGCRVDSNGRPPRVLPTFIGKNRIVQHGFSRYRTRTLKEWVQTHHQLLILELACVGRKPLYLYEAYKCYNGLFLNWDLALV